VWAWATAPKKPRLGLLLEPTSVEDMGSGKKPEPMQVAPQHPRGLWSTP
jgi:hypothetical protein